LFSGCQHLTGLPLASAFAVWLALLDPAIKQAQLHPPTSKVAVQHSWGVSRNRQAAASSTADSTPEDMAPEYLLLLLPLLLLLLRWRLTSLWG
jgi:hypothetical protein